MSVLVNSGIDCVFSDDLKDLDTEESFALLGKINQESRRFLTTENYPFNYCKPRMNYWFSAENFNDVDKLADSLFVTGFHVLQGRDAFMIEGLQDGYCWPWEIK